MSDARDRIGKGGSGLPPPDSVSHTRPRDELDGSHDLEQADTFAMLLGEVARGSEPSLRAQSTRVRPGEALRGGRITITRTLGEGGMGVVYEARDAVRTSPVALKTLTRLDADSVYRLKQEFRSIADITHPNLCRLHELFSDDGLWFFTMELIRGERFDTWVRPQDQLDLARLADGLCQLCDGIDAIHRAGKLHRDLKPSNVLVSEEGRVVVLDFGLAVDAELGGVGQTVTEVSISGTPAYMAPEQAAASAAGPASDLYAIGVMLFEALTDTLPFVGRPWQVYSAKQAQDAPSLTLHAPEVDQELAALCAALLSRDPALRPTTDQVRARLARFREAAAHASVRNLVPRVSFSPSLPSLDGASELVGRGAELALLRAAHARAAGGKAMVVFLSGESGMGKSALMSSFLDERRRREDAVVLAGRCYERENVPYKGFDALIDDLCRCLRRLTREQVLALLPREVFALARVFPVLDRIEAIAEAPARPVADLHDLRRRAFAAFAELIARMRDRQPLCLFIDDLQWLDQDSMHFMRALLVDPDPAPVLWVVSHRLEGADENARLSSIRSAARSNAALQVEQLSLGPLEEASARELARRILGEGSGGEVAPSQLDHVAREASGSPFFLTALARQAKAGSGAASLSLDHVLGALLAELDGPSRRMLEIAALAGQPLALEVLLAASAAEHEAFDELRRRHLMRLAGSDVDQAIECYHDRIRERVAYGLPEAQAMAHYRALGEVVLRRPDAPPELVARCLEGSGQPESAATWAARAAEQAAHSMAFDRAAELFRRALRLAPAHAAQRVDWTIALGSALRGAGRAKAAAEAFIEAAQRKDEGEALELHREATVELLSGGYLEEGTALARRLCREVGLGFPASQGAALAKYALLQARLRLRGLKARPAAPGALSARVREQLSVARAAAHLQVDDPVFGLWAGALYLWLALQAGDSEHLAWALSQEGFNLAVLSPHAEKRIAHIFALARKWAAQCDDPIVRGRVSVVEGAGIHFGRALSRERSRELLDHGLSLLEGQPGARFEVDIARIYVTYSPSSDLVAEAKRTALQIEEAFSLGRWWGAGHLTAFAAPVRMMAGDRDGMLRHLQEAERAARPADKMQWMDLSVHQSFMRLHLYDGDFAAAIERSERIWPRYEGSSVQRGPLGVATMHAHRAVAAIASVNAKDTPAPSRQRLFELARADLRTLRKLGIPIYANYTCALGAGVAFADGDRAGASRWLSELRPVPTYAGIDRLVAQRWLGRLAGGVTGEKQTADAEAAMRSQGVSDIEATTRLLMPGIPNAL